MQGLQSAGWQALKAASGIATGEADFVDASVSLSQAQLQTAISVEVLRTALDNQRTLIDLLA
jgi:hypothetical protein